MTTRRPLTSTLRRFTVAALVLPASMTVATLVTGCADPALTQVAPNHYTIVKSDRLHFYRTTAQLKAQAVAEADAFARARGKLAFAIATSEQPLVPGVEFASVKYQFRLLDPTDPEVRRRVGVTLQPMVFDKAATEAVQTGPAAPAGAASSAAAGS